MDKTKLLISSVGSMVGGSILDELEYIGMREQLTVIGTNSEPNALNNFRCDAVYLVPQTRDYEAFKPRFYEIIKDEQPDLVLAGRDDDTDILAELKAEPDLKNTEFVAPNPEGALLVNDKVKTYEFAQRHHLPFADSAYTEEGLRALIARAGFPLICKPRRGFASRGVYVILNESQAMKVLQAGDNVFQECLGDKDELVSKVPDLEKGYPLFSSLAPLKQYNTTILFGKNSEPFHSIYVEGTFHYGVVYVNEPFEDPELNDAAQLYVEKLSEFGYVGTVSLAWLKDRHGQYKVMEFNGRIGGTSVYRALLGYSELSAIFDHFVFGREPRKRPSPPPKHLQAIKTLVPRLIDKQEVEALRKNGKWIFKSHD